MFNTVSIHSAYDLYIATLKRGKHANIRNEANHPAVGSASEKRNTGEAKHKQASLGTSDASVSTARSDVKSVKGGTKETPEKLCKQFKKSLSNDQVAVHFVGSWLVPSPLNLEYMSEHFASGIPYHQSVFYELNACRKQQPEWSMFALSGMHSLSMS